MNQLQALRLFDYRNGALYWRVDRGNNAKAGARAGRLLGTGYRSIHVSGRRYQEHRLVYLMHHGNMPVEIDHINGDKADNRIENLREADHSRNQINTAARMNQSGHRGVRFVPKTGRWAARIYVAGKEVRIGTFATAEEAANAYKAKATEIYGEFVR